MQTKKECCVSHCGLFTYLLSISNDKDIDSFLGILEKESARRKIKRPNAVAVTPKPKVTESRSEEPFRDGHDYYDFRDEYEGGYPDYGLS